MSRAAEHIDAVLPDGRRVHGLRFAGEGEPIVMLHGLLDSCEGWADVAAAQTRPAIALDLPGFGTSDLPTRPRISAYAEDVSAALSAVGVERCALVGHSL